jgi:hypothetical protein
VEELQRAKAMLEEQKICSICADREIRYIGYLSSPVPPLALFDGSSV